jgi:chromosome segregation ATPase
VKKILPQDAPFKSNQPSAAKQHIQQLEDELARALEKASALDAENARLGKELGKAHIQISESALEIRNLKVQVDAGQQERAILEGKLDAAVKKVDSLEAEVDQLEERLEDSESSRETDAMVFETECRSKDQVYSALYQTHLDLEAKLALVTADLQKKDKQCIELGGKFHALCQELEPVRLEMEEMAATSLALGEENRRLQQLLSEQLQEGGATSSANQFDLEAFRMQVTSAVQRQERAAAQHELAKATEEAKALQAQVDRLSGELKRLEHTRQADKRMSQMKCDAKDKIYSVLSENFKMLLMTQASTPNLDVEKSRKMKEQRITGKSQRRPAGQKTRSRLCGARAGAIAS